MYIIFIYNAIKNYYFILEMLKTFTKTLLIIVYIILIGELTFRVISKFIVISEIEKLKYALYSLKKSKNPQLNYLNIDRKSVV